MAPPLELVDELVLALPDELVLVDELVLPDVLLEELVLPDELTLVEELAPVEELVPPAELDPVLLELVCAPLVLLDALLVDVEPPVPLPDDEPHPKAATSVTAAKT